MAHNLTNQVRSIASVTKAVAASDLSQTVDVDVQGEMLDLKRTVNSMVEQVLYILILHVYFSYWSFSSGNLLEKSPESLWKLAPMAY